MHGMNLSLETDVSRSRHPGWTMLLGSLLVCLVVSTGVHADDTSEPADAAHALGGVRFEPGVEVEFREEQGKSRDELPFDVDFFLVGKVNADSKSARYAVQTWDDVVDCQALDTSLRPAESEFKQASIVDHFDQNGAKDGRAIRALVKALPPKKYFCFWFDTGRTAANPADFRQRMRTALDEKLAKWAETGKTGSVVTIGQFEALRRLLIEEIVGLTDAGQKLVITYADGIEARVDVGKGKLFESGSCPDRLLPAKVPQRNFFDSNVCADQVDPKLRTAVNKILAAQRTREKRLKNLKAANDKAREKLKALSESQELARFVTSLSTEEDDKALVTTLVPDVQKFAELQGLTEDQITFRSHGQNPKSAINLEQVWDPSGLEPLEDQIDLEVIRLEALLLSISQFENSSQLREALDLDPKQTQSNPFDVETLRTVTQEALASFKAVGNRFESVSEILQQRKDAIAGATKEIELREFQDLVISGSTRSTFKTRASWYISADVGVAYAPDLDDVFGYVGTNVYFRPINKAAPLKGSFLKRFSLTFGLGEDLSGTESGVAQLSGVIGNQPLLIGAGYRFSEHFRVSLGAVVFHQDAPSPTVARDELAATPFVSLSFDWNIRSTFSKLITP